MFKIYLEIFKKKNNLNEQFIIGIIIIIRYIIIETNINIKIWIYNSI